MKTKTEDRSVIELRGLTKCYRQVTAVDGVRVKLNNGKIYVVLGACGAGKSTLLGLLAGAIRPTEGSVRVGGFDMAREPARAKRAVAYLPAGAPLPGWLTVEEYLRFEAELRGVPFERAIRRIHDALELTDTISLRTTPISRLSTVGCVRVAIAGMLVSNAETLILDDPTALLTKREREDLCALLLHLAGSKTLIVASESRELATSLGADVLWMEQGKLTAYLTPEELTPERMETMQEALDASNDAPAPRARKAKIRREYDGEYEIIDTEREDGR